MTRGIFRIHLYLALGWTLFVGISLWFHAQKTQEMAKELAMEQARTSLQKDLAIRAFASHAGGIYARQSEIIQPNPYLKVPDRDITTPNGTKLTLVNPAYLMRLLHQNFSNLYGVPGHLTSLRPLNEGNRPNEWETKALQSFEEGKKEYVEYQGEGETRSLRLMIPVITEASCLRCHAHQGYREGDVRGGLSVIIPMQPYQEKTWISLSQDFQLYFIFWMVGLLGLFISYRSTLHYKLDEAKATLTLEAVTDAAAEGIILQDTMGRIILVNPFAQKLLGYSQNELLGKWPKKTFLPAAAQDLNYKEGTTQLVRDEWQHRDGHSFLVEYVSSAFWLEGQRQGQVTLFQDISERVQKEEQLTAAKNEAERASLAKSNFITLMSHELRTPLNGIMGMAQLLLTDSAVQEPFRSDLTVILESGRSLLKVINHVFDFSKLEAKSESVTAHPFLLFDLLKDLEDLFRPSAQSKGIRLLVEPTPLETPLLGDEDMLFRVLSHLISNGIKFTERGMVQVLVQVAFQTEEAVDLRFLVLDTGIGIHPDHYQKIFQSFTQLEDTATRAYGGLGVGLTIVQGLTKLMGGQVSLEPNQPQGTRFYVDLTLPKVR